jgi:hypothetical protein
VLTLLKPWSCTPTCVRCEPCVPACGCAQFEEATIVLSRQTAVRPRRTGTPASTRSSRGHVLAVDGEYGRAVLGEPPTLEGVNLCRRQRKQGLDFREEIVGRKRPISQMHVDDAGTVSPARPRSSSVCWR